jgi:hypothetical protein
MINSGVCSNSRDLAVYHRAEPTWVPSALHQKQIALVKCEAVERLERSTHAVHHHARPSRMPSPVHQEQIALMKCEAVERFGA